ncbi:MAG TPA: hypothetical protein VHO25_22225, partial [Polyangiaceae bacterium]|nr:hypothetical protein [Polyangiaceae bacterium]
MTTVQDLVALQPPGYEAPQHIAFASGIGLHIMALIPAQSGPLRYELEDPGYVLAELCSESARFIVGVSSTQHLGIWFRDNGTNQCHVVVPPNRFVGRWLFLSFEAFVGDGKSGELRIGLDGIIVARNAFTDFDLPRERSTKLSIGFDRDRKRPPQMQLASVITYQKPRAFERTMQAARHLGIYTPSPFPNQQPLRDIDKAVNDIRASRDVLKESLHSFHHREERSMYRSVAVELRKLIFDADPLMPRLWPYARLHRLDSPMTSPLLSAEM